MNQYQKSRRWRSPFIAVVAALGLVASSCGDDSPSRDSVAVESADEATAASPQRIISLSPTHTEILFAIGAGDQVIAIDSMSNYPPESEAVLTDLSAFEPNVEAISGYEPDLVVIGDDFSGLAAQLSAVGIDSWVQAAPTSLDEALDQIRALGDAVGRSDEAGALADQMEADIASIVESTEKPADPLSYYYELDNTLFSLTSNTFVGSILEEFGLRNIADATEGDTDYPQLSAEFIVSQDPDIIFLADVKCCGASRDEVATRAGWESLSAVKSGSVVEIDDDIASRWGPRLVDLVRVVAEGIAAQSTGG